jgi:hypothetical protein
LVYAPFIFEPFRKIPLVCKQYFSYFICISYTSREIMQGSNVDPFHDGDDDDNNNNNNSFLRNFVE